MDTTKTTDEMIASVDATLASWRSAFETSSPSKKGRVINADVDGGGGCGASSSSSSPINDEAKKSSPPWKDPDAYHRRLGTFKPVTYFAKPLTLSPLVCAAFGWENTGKDIIKCRHPKCGATICIAFHPSLDEDSRDRLCQKYLDMLVSSHTSGCPFRSFASRWSKVMHQCGSKGGACDKSKGVDIATKKSNSEHLMNKVSEGLSDSKTNFYVPPYFLSLSGEFLRFEDCSSDGSITSDQVKECALQICDQLQDSELEVMVPDVVANFCREIVPDVDVDHIFYQEESRMTAPYLLSAFGWSLCDEPAGENNCVVAKCNMCQARTWLTQSSRTDEGSSSRKRRRVESRENQANLSLIDSHRVYCPYVSGFSFGAGQQSDLPGWKVVVSNLMKANAQNPVERNS